MNTSQNTFTKILNKIKTRPSQHHSVLKATLINTKLGPMIAIADEINLYLLEFLDRERLEERIIYTTKSMITAGKTGPIISIEAELTSYFAGSLKEFTIPPCFSGSPFQHLVWQELTNIPYGQTRSYLEQASNIGRKRSYRAVANANSTNRLAIIIPCHRVIRSNGDFGGYSGGVNRKKWLIEHEKQYS